MIYEKKEKEIKGVFDKKYFKDAADNVCILLTTSKGRQLLRFETMAYVGLVLTERYDTKSVPKDFHEKWVEIGLNEYKRLKK
jgi:hypothetical protein